MPDFAPTPKDDEAVRWTHWGNWVWTCPCGFEATCSEDVGGHRAWHREQTAKLLHESVDVKTRARR